MNKPLLIPLFFLTALPVFSQERPTTLSGIPVEGMFESGGLYYTDITPAGGTPEAALTGYFLASATTHQGEDSDGWTSTRLEGAPIYGSLTSITIPASISHQGINYSVTAIAPEAFAHCRRLTSVGGGENLRSIGEGAFAGCEQLQVFDCPGGLQAIGDYAFSGCVRLENVSLPHALTILPWGAFFGCSMLKTIVWPESLVQTGGFAFMACESLYAPLGLNQRTTPSQLIRVDEEVAEMTCPADLDFSENPDIKAYTVSKTENGIIHLQRTDTPTAGTQIVIHTVHPDCYLLK